MFLNPRVRVRVGVRVDVSMSMGVSPSLVRNYARNSCGRGLRPCDVTRWVIRIAINAK